MLSVVPNVNYYLNPAEIEFQIPSNKREQRGRDCWSERGRGVEVWESTIVKMTFDPDLEGDDNISVVEASTWKTQHIKGLEVGHAWRGLKKPKRSGFHAMLLSMGRQMEMRGHEGVLFKVLDTNKYDPIDRKKCIL